MVQEIHKKLDWFKRLRKEIPRPGTTFNSKKDYKRSHVKKETQEMIKEETYDSSE